MIYLIALAIIVLLAIVLIQIGRISDLSDRIKGEEVAELDNNTTQGKAMVAFMVAFLVFCIWSAWHYKNVMFGFGPLTSASEHGFELDWIFLITLIFTGIVFVITHILLFWYSYRYRKVKGSTAKFFAHDTKLEMIWTAIPAVVMTILVANGLVAWNRIFKPIGPDQKVINIEATGYQFAWDIRYPGPDGKLGNKDYRNIIPGVNDLGLDWNDEAALDDIILAGSDKIVFAKDSTVHVRITAKDVLHNFYLPHFRLKMDAVPGIPTSFTFRPIKTTDEYKEELRKYPEFQTPSDPKDPTSPPRWEVFQYELACAELCGKGHYSMRRIVDVVPRSEYDTWIKGQKSFYFTNIRNTKYDPWKGKKLFASEIESRAVELKSDIDAFVNDNSGSVSRTILLKHIFYNTGSSSLNDNLSRYELDNLVKILNDKPNLRVELAGHTDSVGDAASNMTLSQERAQKAMDYLIAKGISSSRLVAKGYGQTEPIDTNDTEEGREKNRRTELRILSK